MSCDFAEYLGCIVSVLLSESMIWELSGESNGPNGIIISHGLIALRSGSKKSNIVKEIFISSEKSSKLYQL